MRKVQSDRGRDDMVRVNSSRCGNALKESNELSENMDTIIEAPENSLMGKSDWSQIVHIELVYIIDNSD